MKKFKSFVEDENLKDFEEDLIGEAPPNTADAMKRYKAGKAGFTDKAHLKACLLYTSPSPRDDPLSRMPSSA